MENGNWTAELMFCEDSLIRDFDGGRVLERSGRERMEEWQTARELLH